MDEGLATKENVKERVEQIHEKLESLKVVVVKKNPQLFLPGDSGSIGKNCLGIIPCTDVPSPLALQTKAIADGKTNWSVGAKEFALDCAQAGSDGACFSSRLLDSLSCDVLHFTFQRLKVNAPRC